MVNFDSNVRKLMSPLPDVKIGSGAPLYNIGAVARMTGVSMATLRAWERRYNFPDSKRTSGGHRLYSERDVIRLHWVKERLDEGMQAAQAVHALRHQEQSGHQEPLNQRISPPPDSHIETAPRPTSYQNQLLEVLISGNLSAADVILGEVLAAASPEHLITQVIAPTLAGLGEVWENGKISVATEHFATNYLRQRLLMWMISGAPPRSVPPIVLACAPNEWHEGSLLILGALLRRRRWPVAYLGQALPLPDLAEFVREMQPNLVVLVAMTEASASELMEWPTYLAGVTQDNPPVIGYGGRVYGMAPEWCLRTPGVYLGNTISEGLDRIEQLLISNPLAR
jgi:DNA-binding transcriptional MerR regulator